MNIQRHLFVLATLACAILASGQQRALAVEPANTGTHSAASITDFCGIWRYGNLPWFIPPASGPVR